jgi:hypothetical protein
MTGDKLNKTGEVRPGVETDSTQPQQAESGPDRQKKARSYARLRRRLT